jgi:hypothetical protein
MMQLVFKITLLLLLPIITYESNMLSAQESNKLIPVTNNAADNIDFPYDGRWGWHKVHIRPLKRFLKKSDLTRTRKTDVCFRCHKKNEYKICDPHIQLNKKGDIIREKCLYCHMEKPDERQVTFVTHKKEIKFNRDPGMICLGCHSRQYYIAHPVGANHLLKPSYKMLAIMKTAEKQLGVTLPLDYDGKIMCATCHNPHEKGVIPNEKIGAKGASEKFRVRLPDKVESAAKVANAEVAYRLPGQKVSLICLACHRDLM